MAGRYPWNPTQLDRNRDHKKRSLKGPHWTVGTTWFEKKLSFWSLLISWIDFMGPLLRKEGTFENPKLNRVITQHSEDAN